MASLSVVSVDESEWDAAPDAGLSDVGGRANAKTSLSSSSSSSMLDEPSVVGRARGKLWRRVVPGRAVPGRWSVSSSSATSHRTVPGRRLSGGASCSGEGAAKWAAGGGSGSGRSSNGEGLASVDGPASWASLSSWNESAVTNDATVDARLSMLGEAGSSKDDNVGGKRLSGVSLIASVAGCGLSSSLTSPGTFEDVDAIDRGRSWTMEVAPVSGSRSV